MNQVSPQRIVAFSALGALSLSVAALVIALSTRSQVSELQPTQMRATAIADASTIDGPHLLKAAIPGTLVPAPPSTGGPFGLQANSGIMSWDGGIPVVREPPLDNNSTIRFNLDQSAEPYTNSGNGGTINLTSTGSGTSCLPTITGIFDEGIRCYAFGSSCSSSSCGQWVESPASPGVEPGPNAVTFWAWVYPILLSTGDSSFISVKEYSDSSWSTPYMTMGIFEDSTVQGVWWCFIAVNGTPYQISMASTPPQNDYYIIPEQWNFLGCSWDNTSGNFVQWKNGTNTHGGTGTVTGHPLDYGDHTGRYGVSGTAESAIAGNGRFTGIIDDVGVDGVNHCQDAGASGQCAWMQQTYQNGFWSGQH